MTDPSAAKQHRIALAINGRFLAQPTTGVQRVARELAREIDALVASGEFNFDVRLLCQRDARLDDLDLRAIRMEHVGDTRGHSWEQLTLPFAVGDATLLCLGNTAPALSLLRKRRVALMIHDLSYREFPEAYRYGYRLGHNLLTPLLLRRADPIFTVSDSVRQMLVRRDPSLASRIVLAPNGAWRDREEDGAGAAADDHLLYVGAFSHRKNFDRVLATAIRLVREDHVRFTFVGSVGSILAPTPIDVPADVRDRISFAGHMESTEQLAAIYRGARCLIFPSLYEASPLPPVEAMHFGCPVVASDIPAMRERCGEAAEYCDPRDVDSIVAAVRRVIRDPGRSSALVALGRARAQRFSWAKQARIVLSAIRDAHAGEITGIEQIEADAGSSRGAT